MPACKVLHEPRDCQGRLGASCKAREVSYHCGHGGRGGTSIRPGACTFAYAELEYAQTGRIHPADEHADPGTERNRVSSCIQLEAKIRALRRQLFTAVLHSESKKIDTWCSLLHFMKFAQRVSQRRHGPVILLIVTVMSTLL